MILKWRKPLRIVAIWNVVLLTLGVITWYLSCLSVYTGFIPHDSIGLSCELSIIDGYEIIPVCIFAFAVILSLVFLILAWKLIWTTDKNTTMEEAHRGIGSWLRWTVFFILVALAAMAVGGLNNLFDVVYSVVVISHQLVILFIVTLHAAELSAVVNWKDEVLVAHDI